MSWARQRPVDICPGLSDQASTQTHADDGCGGGHKYDRTVLQHEEHFCCYIVSVIQAPNKHHLLLTIGYYISLDTWGQLQNKQSKHLLQGCICSLVWWGLWWGALFPEYKVEYCAAPGDISDRFAAPRLYLQHTGRRSPLSHVHQQLSPGAITARVHRVHVTRLPA